MASYYPVTMFSSADAGERLPEAQYCELDVVPGDLNRYTLTGCLTQRADPLPAGLCHSGWRRLCRCHFKDELKQAGITYTGTLLRQTQVNEPGTVICQQTVRATAWLLKIMLKKVG